MARRCHPHVLVISYPAQGHIAPLMKLSLKIAAQGVKVTFVNTEFIHEKITVSAPKQVKEQSLISLVSIPDGLPLDGDDRNDVFKLAESMRRVMPGHLEDLIVKLNQSNINEQIKCVIAETSVGWALEVAKKMGIGAVAVWPFGAACLVLAAHIPQLIEAQIISNDGTPLKEIIKLSEDIPPWRSSETAWSCSDPVMQKFLFEFGCMVPKYARFYDSILCNSFHELESSALKLIPNILPVGPLLASNHSGAFPGNFWPEDSTCLEWLDKQTAHSVIYIAFGSTTILSARQVNELALGLELTGHPFLWVVRSDFSDASPAKFPDGFIDRVADHGKLVEWAPQEKVLAHPSLACFLSHCGWNSTMEGLTMGVPFLCWPYFGDQFCNRNYICDVWNIGLSLVKDENGIITRQEISSKIEALLSSEVIKANALHLKNIAKKSVSESGSSFKNLESFIEQIKTQI
ncbi:hypothetical protein DITRI_Ditri04bG0042900 [Diplodiscus trichospermus]